MIGPLAFVLSLCKETERWELPSSLCPTKIGSRNSVANNPHGKWKGAGLIAYWAWWWGGGQGQGRNFGKDPNRTQTIQGYVIPWDRSCSLLSLLLNVCMCLPPWPPGQEILSKVISSPSLVKIPSCIVELFHIKTEVKTKPCMQVNTLENSTHSTRSA